MNSSEQKDSDQVTPTKNEVQETIATVRAILASTQSGPSAKDSDLTEGCKEALDILSNGKHFHDQISEHLKTDRGRAIAVLAVDYLNGACERDVLTGYIMKSYEES